MSGVSFLDILSQDNGYTAYVLLIIVIGYFINQYDRYIYTVAEIPFVNYDSYEYGLIAGPLFTIIYTIAGIFIGFLSQNHRVKFVAASVLFWSVTVGLVSATSAFWQVALLRAGLGLGQSAYTPLSTSVLGDYFPMEMRATALGVYNIGIYAGYGFSLGVGSLINNIVGWRWSYLIGGIAAAGIASLMILTIKEPSPADKTGRGPAPDEEDNIDHPTLREILKYWGTRGSLLMLCIAGGIRNAGGYCWGNYTAIFFSELFTTMEDQSSTCVYSYSADYAGAQVCDADYPFCRNGECVRISDDPWHDVGMPSERFAAFISLVPLIAGSLGAILGGYVSDRVAKGKSSSRRIFVIIISNLLAAPFGAGVLLAPYPWCFICLMGSYIFGEMWIGVLLALIIELVPKSFSATSIAVYLFIITNIGGNAPLLVPFFQQAFQQDHTYTFDASPTIDSGLNSDTETFHVTQSGSVGLRDALLWLYPGVYAISSLFFLVSLCFLKKDLDNAQASEEFGCSTLQPLIDENESSRLKDI
mmetsp:Transcript_35725/g.47135  ORF Transcript_35725/g.47135 Transcript_35725/m.47135 type:complete len:529 (-) Transcript_35725:213-1799(-)|eukprot:CAMPEP_0117870864 /NCGR_PEP_ID=MMETSP0950-20121206/10120_1 /TAXON_ID=44440 /ORGANISM="Chattonella subsalsa, Strain CCMP2191" /LENGTH=528 /DNA_ID=CAMNT_0005723285 /DNA_START=47 /DNA_END=1633 /DNA_ORIENTATION=-